MHLFRAMMAIVPVDGDEWEMVLAEHSKSYPGREVDSIKRKFATIHRRKAPSGDPNIPEYVRMAKELKDMIRDKAMLNVGDEIYDMEDGGTFTSPDGTVRGVVPVPVARTSGEGASVSGISVAGTSVAVTCDAVDHSPNRGRGKKPDMMSVMMLYMKDEKERRIHEAEEKSADRVAMVQMVGKIATGYFKCERKKRSTESKRKKRRQRKRRMRRNIGTGRSNKRKHTTSSSSDSSECSISSDSSDSSDNESCARKLVSK